MQLIDAGRALLLLAGASAASAAGGETLGRCRFDTRAGAFVGAPGVQAACLLRTVQPLGRVAAQPAVLGPNLHAIVGNPPPVTKAEMRAILARVGSSETALGGSLDQPLSRGGGNAPSAPAARYLVIHDTSTPNFGSDQFPADIDIGDRVNGLGRYRSAGNAVAHIFLNRRGETYVGHPLDTPWRATKLEGRVGIPAKGLFLHIETVQPRRRHPSQPDGTAPVPGFTRAQYDGLALIYMAASVRAGRGLIPAFHAAIDDGLAGGHDDPQNFDLCEFDAAIGRLLALAQ